MNRREACRTLGLAGAGALVFPGGAAALRPFPATSLEPIGLQLYTVRDRLADDFEGALATVAEIGYREVEFAGYFGHSPGRIREITARLGLDPVAAHVSLPQLREDLAGVLGAATEIGHRYVVLPSLPRSERRDLDAYRRVAGEMNRLGAACRDAGLRFAFHNHDTSLQPIDGVRPYDLLLEDTDPDLVDFEIDLYWAARGGLDPLEAFAAWPGRFPLCHVKDMTADGEMADVGAGVLDFAAVFRHAEQAGLRHFLVEHDHPADPLASIRASHGYLAGARLGVHP